MAATGKKLRRRAGPDRSQALRRAFQLAFLLLNRLDRRAVLSLRPLLRDRRAGPSASRPPGVEGWLPIAALMNLKVLLATGEVPRLHPAGMFLLIAFLAIVVAGAQELL